MIEPHNFRPETPAHPVAAGAKFKQAFDSKRAIDGF
jgi:hypothetical protein